MIVIVFTVAHVALVPTDEKSVQLLAPFQNESDARGMGLTAEDYAVAAAAIEGKEFSIEGLIDSGVLDEDGNPMEGVVVVRLP